MKKTIRIGTRESQLAVWQASQVQALLTQQGLSAELVPIKSEGDIDLKTPLYEMGVQGIFTRTLDLALLNDRIDVAVHSLKDVPTQLPEGIVTGAVLKRGSWKDLLVLRPGLSTAGAQSLLGKNAESLIIATSSIRRKAQWLNRYTNHSIENLRGNVNTRLQKLHDSNWHGAIFAAAGLERIQLRPEASIELDWMLPAPAQGAIAVVCRENDAYTYEACRRFNDDTTEHCTQVERDFLRALMGGCSTPISALAEIKNGQIFFRGNILSPDGKEKAGIEKTAPAHEWNALGRAAAAELLQTGGQAIAEQLRNDKK